MMDVIFTNATLSLEIGEDGVTFVRAKFYVGHNENRSLVVCLDGELAKRVGFIALGVPTIDHRPMNTRVHEWLGRTYRYTNKTVWTLVRIYPSAYAGTTGVTFSANNGKRFLQMGSDAFLDHLHSGRMKETEPHGVARTRALLVHHVDVPMQGTSPAGTKPHPRIRKGKRQAQKATRKGQSARK